MPREYRSRNRILLDLLRAVKQEPEAGTTRLLLLANLSHDRLQEYLSDALTRGLLVPDDSGDKKTFKLTPKGQDVLTELDRIQRVMADFGMSL